MQYERSCRNCRRRDTGDCYEVRPRLCDRYAPPLTDSDRQVWQAAKEEAEARRYPKERSDD